MKFIGLRRGVMVCETRIFTKLGLYKSLYFLLSHEFSPDGELFCEYIMI